MLETLLGEDEGKLASLAYSRAASDSESRTATTGGHAMPTLQIRAPDCSRASAARLPVRCSEGRIMMVEWFPAKDDRTGKGPGKEIEILSACGW